MIWRVSGSPFAAFRRLRSCSGASNAALSFSRSGDVAIAFSSASRNGVSFFFSVCACSIMRVALAACVFSSVCRRRYSKKAPALVFYGTFADRTCLAACLDVLSS